MNPCKHDESGILFMQNSRVINLNLGEDWTLGISFEFQSNSNFHIIVWLGNEVEATSNQLTCKLLSNRFLIVFHRVAASQRNKSKQTVQDQFQFFTRFFGFTSKQDGGFSQNRKTGPGFDPGVGSELNPGFQESRGPHPLGREVSASNRGRRRLPGRGRFRLEEVAGRRRSAKLAVLRTSGHRLVTFLSLHSPKEKPDVT